MLSKSQCKERRGRTPYSHSSRGVVCILRLNNWSEFTSMLLSFQQEMQVDKVLQSLIAPAHKNGTANPPHKSVFSSSYNSRYVSAGCQRLLLVGDGEIQDIWQPPIRRHPRHKWRSPSPWEDKCGMVLRSTLWHSDSFIRYPHPPSSDVNGNIQGS